MLFRLAEGGNESSMRVQLSCLMIVTMLRSSIDGTSEIPNNTSHMQAIERMKEEVHQEHPEKQLAVEYMQLDLASFQSTKDFTIAFKEKNLPLHLLINNAGVAWVPYSEFLPFVL